MKSIVFAAAFALASSQAFAMDSLSDLKWKNRVVIIFGASTDPEASQQTVAIKEQTSELADRDMVVLRVSGDGVHPVYGKSPRVVDAQALKKDVGVEDDGFHVVLIGKDGGVKLRSERPVGGLEMFDLIDRMPMRKSGRG